MLIMRTVVIPDIHQRIGWVEKIISLEPSADEFVFLGDWFDAWEGSHGISSFGETCLYLRNLATAHPLAHRFVFLVGNHDMPYIYQNSSSSRTSVKNTEAYSCSGFTRSKARTFRKVFYETGLRDGFFISNFAPAYRTQGVTLSHAGIHPSYLLPGENLESLMSFRLPLVWSNFRNRALAGNDLLSSCGHARGGLEQHGGLLWLDWNVEFVPSESLGRQVVGHTSIQEPSARRLGFSDESWNIDTGRDYAVLVDGVITTRHLE